MTGERLPRFSKGAASFGASGQRAGASKEMTMDMMRDSVFYCQLLRQHHDDYAALRRYLVDAGFLQREQGVYWRIGETGPEGSGWNGRLCLPQL